MKIVHRTKWYRLKSGVIGSAYIMALAAGVLNPTFVKADATLNYSGSTLSGAPEESVAITNLSVGGSDATIPVLLSVDEGILSFQTTAGLIFNTASSGRTISFRGTVADVNNALATLHYRSIAPGGKTISATIIDSGVVYNPDNGHFYESINHNSSVTWNDAKNVAEERALNGATGYLATITSEAEFNYLVGKLNDDGWFGASDVDSEGDWKWTTGPEAGTSFWAGDATGSVITDQFAHWASNEPNDFESNEDCAQFYKDGAGWNDIPCSGTYMDHSIIEYGSIGNMPTAPPHVTIDVTINEPTRNTITVSTCEQLAGLQTSLGASRYDTVSLNNSIDCTGVPLEPLFSQADPDYDVIGFSGEFDGNGFQITNTVINQIDADNVGLFAASNNANFHDVSISGSTTGHTCTGAFVGTARNSSFSNITINNTVQGWQNVGGLAGCMTTSGSNAHTTNQVVVSGSVSSESSVVGGIVGTATFASDAAYTVTNTQSSSTLSANEWGVGGAFGELRVSSAGSVNISGFTATASDVLPAYSAGIIAGIASTQDSSILTVSSVTASGTLIAAENAGGIFGEAYNNTNISNSITIHDVDIPVNVTAANNGRAGGLVGYGERITINNSASQGTVTAETTDAGGLAGLLYDSTITDSKATGDITAVSAVAGGAVGSFIGGTMQSTLATGAVSATANTAGGLIGYFEGLTQDSYARGSTSGDTMVGGLVGNCNVGSILRSYSTGAVVGTTDAGGLVGLANDCTSIDTFWDTEVSTQATSASSETGKTTLELKTRETLLDTQTTGLSSPWDFETIWEMNELINNGYPCLKWQAATCTMPDWVDEDTDGVPSTVEDAAPNNGDGNNDGTPDSNQQNVTSLVNEVSSTYTAVELDPVCTFSDISITPENGQPNQDGGFDYSSGLINFTAGCGTPGYSTEVTIVTYGVDVNGLILRKYNPITSSYTTIDSAVLTATTINGQPAVTATYQVVDGGPLDTDGVENGVIVDPVGFAKITPIVVPPKEDKDKKDKKEKKDKKDKGERESKDSKEDTKSNKENTSTKDENKSNGPQNHNNKR